MVIKLNSEVRALKQDVREMKKFLFAPVRDPEGSYKSTFTKKMLARVAESGATSYFEGKDSFLKHVRSKK